MERLSAPPFPPLPIPPSRECGIALGSNTGDRPAHLRAAISALREMDPRLEASPVYETAPVDCPDGSGPFLNAAVILTWTATPEALLHALRGIESRLGRPAERARNAPRTVDLDILYAGDAILGGHELALPHPRLHERRFVLQPLCDLRPDLVLPGFEKTIRQMLAELPNETNPPQRVTVSL